MTIICIGDSIMQYNDCTSYPQTGWVQLLDRFFAPGTRILNFARNGRSTKSFIDEGRFARVMDVASEGDFALIQFAHNDEKANDPARYTDCGPGGEFRKNLKFFAEEFLKKGTKPVFLTPVTRRKFVSDTEISNSHGDYPAAIKETAAELNIPCIDLTSLTMDFFGKEGKEMSRRFFMNFDKDLYENFPEGKSDDSHLRPDGAYQVCRLFTKELAEIKSRWPEYGALADSLSLKGIYNDKDIDDEMLMWK